MYIYIYVCVCIYIYVKVLRRLAGRSYGDFYIFLVCEMQGPTLFSFFLFLKKIKIKKRSIGQKLYAWGDLIGVNFDQF